MQENAGEEATRKHEKRLRGNKRDGELEKSFTYLGHNPQGSGCHAQPRRRQKRGVWEIKRDEYEVPEEIL